MTRESKEKVQTSITINTFCCDWKLCFAKEETRWAGYLWSSETMGLSCVDSAGPPWKDPEEIISWDIKHLPKLWYKTPCFTCSRWGRLVCWRFAYKTQVLCLKKYHASFNSLRADEKQEKATAHSLNPVEENKYNAMFELPDFLEIFWWIQIFKSRYIKFWHLSVMSRADNFWLYRWSSDSHKDE